jgi:CubicO group peptidase (beta-lactamase class C family)
MPRFTRREFNLVALALGSQSSSLFGETRTIDAVLSNGAKQRGIPAVVAIAGTATATTYSGAFGTRDSASGVAVATDSIFSIASMTKAITSAAAMLLVERGKMTLDEPASKHLPELGMLQVLDSFDASGKPNLRPPATAVTLRQLLTHTSGFAYNTWHEATFKFMSSGGDATHVLAFDPGAKWQYGPSTFWAGRLVEAVSGQDLENFLQQNILGPLAMKDTTFIFPKEKFDRLMGSYQREANGSLTAQARTLPKPPAVYRGDGGLYSTAPDYLRFAQMILRKGMGPGRDRVLQEKTVMQMSVNGTGQIAAGRLKSYDARMSSDVDFHAGHDDRYTLGFLMNPEGIPGARSAGSLAWAGLYNTYYWIDPKKGVTGIILMQFLPFADKEAVGMLDDFQRAVYAAHT